MASRYLMIAGSVSKERTPLRLERSSLRVRRGSDRAAPETAKRIVYRTPHPSSRVVDASADVFLLPGPVKMDPRVLQAMSVPAMNHRGAEFKDITVCWNETSTGLTNPIAEIAKAVKARDAFLLVDGITAVGGLENRMEAWGIDALVMGSQKCLAAPPGLSAVALSKRAYESLHSDTSFYTNLKAHVDALAKQDTPFTPAVPLFLAFQEALRLLKSEALGTRIARTTRLAEAARAAVEALGLELYPERRYASNTVTAIRYPPGIDDAKFRKELRDRYRTIVAGGQAQPHGQNFPIGPKGVFRPGDFVAGLSALPQN